MTLGTFSGKALLLEDVIYNLSVNSDHYKNATLSFVIGEMQHKALFERFHEQRIIEGCSNTVDPETMTSLRINPL
ncbi:hypothetical protein DVH05_013818 [Phytophthora capsici]|nr:hypothetical protein DVH05_013818 [Phytophthora capsici]